MIRYPWDFDIVGVLPNEDYLRDQFDRQSVFINRQNSAQFLIEPLSQVPVNFPNINYFTGYGSDIESFGFEDDLDASRTERENLVREFFADRLIIFSPIQIGEHYKLSYVRTKGKGELFDDQMRFVPIPVFSNDVHKYTYEEFIERLQQNKTVGRIKGISTESSDTPSIVLWQHNLLCDNQEPILTVIGEFDKHRYPQGGYILNSTCLKSYPFDNSWLDYIISHEDNPTLIFVSKRIYEEMIDRLKSAPEIKPETHTDTTTMPVIDTELIKQETEITFIENFIQLTREQGLAYDPQDLVNFHTAMKSSALVILSGMSGTGKSQLVQQYGNALGMDPTQLTIIPVSPAWTDDADLIGHVDTSHMVYRPGDCGLVNTLIQASVENERLFIICFDEMNLARVEHYFSQFLSVLEMEPSRRVLKLYNEEVQQRLYNGTEYLPAIRIGANVKFVGTLNIDESTYHFSDKVLDRANVISLNVLDFSELRLLDRKKSVKQPEVSLGQYLSYQKEEEKIELPDQEIKFLTGMNQCLRKASHKLGFGPRVVRQIEKYLANLPDNQWLSRDEAIDLQIVQRVLTKLRGPDEQIKPIIGNYNIKSGQIENGEIYEVLDSFSDVSSFIKTRHILANKAKELKLYGFTI